MAIQPSWALEGIPGPSHPIRVPLCTRLCHHPWLPSSLSTQVGNLQLAPSTISSQTPGPRQMESLVLLTLEQVLQTWLTTAPTWTSFETVRCLLPLHCKPWSVVWLTRSLSARRERTLGHTSLLKEHRWFRTHQAGALQVSSLTPPFSNHMTGCPHEAPWAPPLSTLQAVGPTHLLA